MASLLLPGNVDCIAPLPNGQLAVGLSTFTGELWTGAIALVDADGLHLQSLVETLAGVPALAVLERPDQFTGRRVLASGGDDGSVDLWFLQPHAAGDSQPLQRTQTKVLHNGAVLALAAAADDTRLASASADGTLRLWDCNQLLACTAQLGGGDSVGGSAALNTVAWTADHTVATVGQTGQLCMWDARQLSSTPAAAAAVGAPGLSLAVRNASQGQLVVGDLLGRVAVYDCRCLGQPVQQKQLHQDAVHSLASTRSGSGSLVASGGDDGAVMLLDCSCLGASRQLVGAKGAGETPCYIRALAWQKQQPQRLYRGGWDQTIATVAL
ncbi:Vegetative incompatibility protein HET-E-1 [Chlorella vulgaris]